MSAERVQDIVEIYRFDETSLTFSSSCVLIYCKNVVTVKGLASGITRSNWKELRAYLRKSSVYKLVYDRRKSNITLHKEWLVK